ncbi:hypothetical protein BC834DRAFT_71361 [Gloeopeniophorella convolvens]|nr:hypothetical protein BC834DRAFT_71361 [Gloeopeniophorella convolvens]
MFSLPLYSFWFLPHSWADNSSKHGHNLRMLLCLGRSVGVVSVEQRTLRCGVSPPRSAVPSFIDTFCSMLLLSTPLFGKYVTLIPLPSLGCLSPLCPCLSRLHAAASILLGLARVLLDHSIIFVAVKRHGKNLPAPALSRLNCGFVGRGVWWRQALSMARRFCAEPHHSKKPIRCVGRHNRFSETCHGAGADLYSETFVISAAEMLSQVKGTLGGIPSHMGRSGSLGAVAGSYVEKGST